MDQRLVFSGLALELVVASWPIPVGLLYPTVDLFTQGKLFLILAEASLVLAPASLGLTVGGLLRKRTTTLTYRKPLIAVGLLAVSLTLVSSLMVFDIVFIYSEGCDPLTAWKCYFVQGGNYLSYYFIPAIAVPILTLFWVSRTRLPNPSV